MTTCNVCGDTYEGKTCGSCDWHECQERRYAHSLRACSAHVTDDEFPIRPEQPPCEGCGALHESWQDCQDARREWEAFMEGDIPF